MVQPAEDRRGDYLRLSGKAMTGGRELIRVGHPLWNARSQAGGDDLDCSGPPIHQGRAGDGPRAWDQPVETLPTYRADQSLAERVRLRRPRGRLRHMPFHRADGLIDGRRIDASPIVEDEPAGRRRSDDPAELLDFPRRRRMLGDVPVQDSTRAGLDDDEDVENPEADRQRREEVTGHDRVRIGSGQTWSTVGTATHHAGAAAAGDTVRCSFVRRVWFNQATLQGPAAGHWCDALRLPAGSPNWTRLPNDLSGPSSPSDWREWCHSAKGTSGLPYRAFVDHDHKERPHQGLGNECIAPTTTETGTGPVRCGAVNASAACSGSSTAQPRSAGGRVVAPDGVGQTGDRYAERVLTRTCVHCGATPISVRELRPSAGVQLTNEHRRSRFSGHHQSDRDGRWKAAGRKV